MPSVLCTGGFGEMRMTVDQFLEIRTASLAIRAIGCKERGLSLAG